jgi:hypothetical protein
MAPRGSVDGRTYTLRELFRHAVYAIDYYQREYAWSADDVRTLLEDLFGAFNREPRSYSWWRSREHGEPYFLGPFVFVEEDRGSRLLVDGQQRFTTLHLIFLHLYRRAHDLQERTTLEQLSPVILDDVVAGHPRFRIDIDERSSLLEALYFDRKYQLPSNATISVRTLWARSNQIADLLATLPSEDFARFTDWLLNGVVLVGIEAPTRNSGLRIFESMNDRGARLTPVDLLKSFLLAGVGAEQDKLNRSWRDMLAALTRERDTGDSPHAFLKAFLIAHHADVSRVEDIEAIERGLHIWVKENRTKLGLNQDDRFFRFVEDLIALAGHYTSLLRATKKPYPEQNLSCVYFNQINGLQHQLTLALAAIRPDDTSDTAKEKASLVTTYLDRMFVDRVLHDKPFGREDADEELCQLVPTLQECRTADEVAAALGARWPSDSFAAVAEIGLRGNNRPQIRYLLARLTAFVETGCGQPDRIEEYLATDRPHHIEHLFANHPERHREEVPDEAQFRVLRNSLGGLALLPGTDNSSYGDAPINEKLAWYSRQNNLVAILSPKHLERNATARQFAKKHSIEPEFHAFRYDGSMREVLRVRTELYRKLFRRIWSADSLKFPAVIHDDGMQPEPTRVRPLNTHLGRMVACGVVSPGTELIAMHRGREHHAVVERDGALRVYGDRFGSADEAGKQVRGTRSCQGMAFWHCITPDGKRTSLRALRDAALADGRLELRRSKRGD